MEISTFKADVAETACCYPNTHPPCWLVPLPPTHACGHFTVFWPRRREGGSAAHQPCPSVTPPLPLAASLESGHGGRSSSCCLRSRG